MDNSYVEKYCGGPKFGNMNLDENTPANNKTVTTNATGTTFGVYYGGGNGGTSYVQYDSSDATVNDVTDGTYSWDATANSGNPAHGNGKLNNYTPRKYRNKATGYHADYEMEIVNTSTGTDGKKAIIRTYMYSAQFSATNTGPITNNLTDCKVLTNFYGGGNLGGVKGSVTSTLSGNTRVEGSVFGAGYSASVPEVTIYDKNKTPPTINIYTGIITPTPDPDLASTSTTYTWTDKTFLGGKTLKTSDPIVTVDGKNYFYTEESLDGLGTITGDIFLNIEGSTKIYGKVFDENGSEDTTKKGGVYGGGDESKVTGDVTINVKDNVEVLGNVFGGGNEGLVEGTAKVNIMYTE
jgi:hypothetical protein